MRPNPTNAERKGHERHQERWKQSGRKLAPVTQSSDDAPSGEEHGDCQRDRDIDREGMVRQALAKMLIHCLANGSPVCSPASILA